MRSCLISFIVVNLLLLNTVQVFAQHHHEVDSVMDFSPLYLPTYYTHIKFIEFQPLKFTSIDTGMVDTHLYEPSLHTENIYQNLGLNGNPHQSIIFDYKRDMGFLYQTLPYPLYFKKQSDLAFYKLQTVYAKIAYTYGTDFSGSENNLFAEFAQYIRGVTVSANLYASRRGEGPFVNQGLTNLSGDILIHYEMPSSIYGFRASYIINRADNKEKKENGGYEVFSPNASSLITTHDLALQNYVNLKSKNGKYFGTFSYDFQLEQTTIHYKDAFDAAKPKYEFYFDSNTTTNDSVRIQNVKNAIQWSNFAPYKEQCDKNNFFRIAGGVLYDYANLKYIYTPFNSLYLFARTHIRLFKVMEITGDVSYSLISDYSNNDLAAKAGISWTLNREKEHKIGLNIAYYENNPEYIMQHVFVNNFRWINQFQKQNIIQLKAFWNYQKYYTSVSYYYLNRLVYLSEALRPVQNSNNGNLIQISTYLPFRYKHFGATANLNMQYCTKDVVNVPLFAGKLSVFYTIELLKKRLKILVGTDIMYNSVYYADAYLPVLHKFYYQKSQLAGNFVYIDANLTVQIERINFFGRIGNILGTVINRNNYTTPNYPSNYLINVGISWRFHD